MTATAADRLDTLKSDIEARLASIEGLREEYAELLTAGDDAAADKVAAKIRKDESTLAILKDRLPVLEELTGQEADEARAVEADRLTQEANEIREGLKAQLAKAVKLAEQLRKAVSEIEENSDLQWYLVAKKARELGGDPIHKDIEGLGEFFGNMEYAKRRVVGAAQAYSHRVTQMTISR